MSPRVAQRVRKVKPRKVNRAFGRLHWRSSPTHKKKTNQNPELESRKGDFIYLHEY
jgi:hypothetical protein